MQPSSKCRVICLCLSYLVIVPGKPAHWGQVMWGMVRVLRSFFGVSWPEHAVIVDFSVVEKLDLIALQGYPKLIFVLLCPGFANSHLFEY